VRGDGLPSGKSFAKAVDDVSFDLSAGEVLGLVGESGSGKTTTGRAVLRLVDIFEGSVMFLGQEISRLSARRLRPLRRNMQLVSQDPFASLNPFMTVEAIIAEPLDVHRISRGHARQKRVHDLLELVGLPAKLAKRLPAELSGGQRQRVSIARALAPEPVLIVCDEPTSALDVSIQAQILGLLGRLRKELDLSLFFISHDLGVIHELADRVAVMYAGQLVEVAPKESFFRTAYHPYTQALLSAVPVPDPETERKRRRIVLQGELPNPTSPPPGCRFHTRCQYAQDICWVVDPALSVVAQNHLVACHFWNEISQGTLSRFEPAVAVDGSAAN
jgi:oligopeptide/dipeptide ABC transporter ATP-binding protein